MKVFSFCERRFGTVVASQLVDAVCFGIYGISSRMLSARAFLGDVCLLEQRFYCTYSLETHFAVMAVCCVGCRPCFNRDAFNRLTTLRHWINMLCSYCKHIKVRVFYSQFRLYRQAKCGALPMVLESWSMHCSRISNRRHVSAFWSLSTDCLQKVQLLSNTSCRGVQQHASGALSVQHDGGVAVADKVIIAVGASTFVCFALCHELMATELHNTLPLSPTLQPRFVGFP
jgi:hypothetical protein